MIEFGWYHESGLSSQNEGERPLSYLYELKVSVAVQKRNGLLIRKARTEALIPEGIMVIDRKTAEYVADLSRLRIAEGEIDSICRELSTILDYMDEINSSIDTDTVVSRVGGLTNVIREDRVLDSMDRTELLSNAPEHTDETPIVPRIVR